MISIPMISRKWGYPEDLKIYVDSFVRTELISWGGEIPPGFSPLAMIPITLKGDKIEKEITP
jgi:hypothetical protein